MKCLVTGAAGFLGSNLCTLLLEQGMQVTGLDNFSEYYSPAIKRATAQQLRDRGVSWVEADLASDDLEGVVSEAGVIAHFAAQSGISATTPEESYRRNNIVATQSLLEAAKENKSLRLFIYISSSSVYGKEATGDEKSNLQPSSWYGSSKLSAEQYALDAYRKNEFPACSLRLFSVYGMRERPEKLVPKLIRSLVNETAFTLCEGSLEHKRSFTFVGDVVEAISLAIAKPENVVGEIFNVGNPQSHTTGEVIEALETIAGRKAVLDAAPRRPGDQSVTQANIEKIRERLCWEPKTSLEQGLAAVYDWYMADVHGKIDWV